MKKLALTVLMTMIAAAAFAGEDAKDESLNGGFWYGGFQTTWQPQTELNNQLSTLGYSGLSDLGMGMIYGGGGLIHNFFLGGWGAVDFGTSTSVNSNAGKTIEKDSGGRGGFELGYAVLHTPGFTLIPALDLIWGGADYTFKTNISFSDFVKNPVTFAPDFSTGHFSVGASLMGLIHFNDKTLTGLMLKVTYLYALSGDYGPANFSAAPAFGQHTLTGSVSFTFGGYAGTRLDGEKMSGRVIREELKEEIKKELRKEMLQTNEKSTNQ